MDNFLHESTGWTKLKKNS